MFSPNTCIYNDNGNASSKAKKLDSVTKSVKKPLGDISVNRTAKKKSPKAFQSKQPVFNKTEPTIVIEMFPKENYPDWYEDISSRKEVQDSYNDILPRSQRIMKADFENIFHCLSPPPTKRFKIDTMFFTIPRDNSLQEFNLEFDPMEMNDGIPMPDIIL